MRRLCTFAVLVALLALAGCGGLAAQSSEAPAAGGDYYMRGKVLVAAPGLLDPRFAETVIYVIEHDSQGALGLVVNRPLGTGPLDKFLEGFGLAFRKTDAEVTLNYGGPVEPYSLFVLHSTDWRGPHTFPTTGSIAVTPHPDVLAALAEQDGPRRSLTVLGYAGWGPQQLDREITRGDWTPAPADPALIFGGDPETMWERASGIAGLEL